MAPVRLLSALGMPLELLRVMRDDKLGLDVKRLTGLIASVVFRLYICYVPYT